MTNSDAERRIAALEAEIAQLRAGQAPLPVADDHIASDKVAGDKVAGDKQQGAVELSGSARVGVAVAPVEHKRRLKAEG